MAQISPPFRIALVAIALLGAVWFVALRPKAESGADAPLPAAPGVTGLSNATEQAEATAKAADASAERAEAAAAAADGGAAAAEKTTVTKTQSGATVKTSTSAAKSSSGKAAVTKKAAVKPAAPVNPAAPLLAALKRGQVVVLLFRNKSSDSASVATMVRAIGERRKVVSRVVSIKDVGRYSTFTSTTPVAQAPTTMVIGPKRNAVLIVGFTSPGEIAQAVADVRRAGT
jgi:cytoskeletal protein RodZ